MESMHNIVFIVVVFNAASLNNRELRLRNVDHPLLLPVLF